MAFRVALSHLPPFFLTGYVLTISAVPGIAASGNGALRPRRRCWSASAVFAAFISAAGSLVSPQANW